MIVDLLISIYYGRSYDIRDSICSCNAGMRYLKAVILRVRYESWKQYYYEFAKCVERTFFLHRKMSCCYSYFLNKSIANNYGTRTTYTRRHLFVPMISTGMQCLKAIVRLWLTSVLNEHFFCTGKWVVAMHISLTIFKYRKVNKYGRRTIPFLWARPTLSSQGGGVSQPLVVVVASHWVRRGGLLFKFLLVLTTQRSTCKKYSKLNGNVAAMCLHLWMYWLSGRDTVRPVTNFSNFRCACAIRRICINFSYICWTLIGFLARTPTHTFSQRASAAPVRVPRFL